MSGPSSAVRKMLFLLLFMLPAGLGAQDIEPLLRGQTVMITVTRSPEGEDQFDENGSGVILCQDEDHAYILTARHVLFGTSLPGRMAPGLRDVTRIQVSFFKDVAPALTEDRTKQEEVFTIQQAGTERDLLLLTAPVARILPVTASLGSATAKDALGKDTQVVAIGYRPGEGSQTESWALEKGAIRVRGTGLIHHSAIITKGFSGGPLFDAGGALVGINIEIGDRSEPDTGLTIPHGHALPIEEVVATVDKWIPATCLRSLDPLRERAYDIYRRAMQAVSVKRWREAEMLMREALKDIAWEGGSVHLQGMRYTEYLPRYHLGLALYRQGEENCGAAVQEWRRSEVQQAIKGNRRYRTMERLRHRCIEILKQQLQAAPRPE